MFKRLSVILFMLLIVFIGFGIIIPVLPLMITSAGAQAYHVGFMLAAYSLVALFISPWWGRLSDRIGRKPVLIIGLLGFAVTFLIFGLSSQHLWIMYLSRLIGGGFSGAVTATAMAYVADVTDTAERTKGMAYAGIAIGLGFIFGPAAGGLLSSFGLAVPFYAASVLALLNAIWGIFTLPESLTADKRRERIVNSESPWIAWRGPLKYLYAVDFVSQFCISTLEGCFQLYQDAKIHASATDIGWMFFISGIVGALVQGGIVRRLKPGSEIKAMVYGLIISGVGMFLLLFSTDFWNAAFFMTIFGASNTVIKPTLQSVITKETKVGLGLASGLISSMDSLGRIIGPIIATTLFSVKIDLPFIFAGIVAITSIVLILSYLNGSNREINSLELS